MYLWRLLLLVAASGTACALSMCGSAPCHAQGGDSRQATESAAEYEEGDVVEVEALGEWRLGKVDKVTGSGGYRVKYRINGRQKTNTFPAGKVRRRSGENAEKTFAEDALTALRKWTDVSGKHSVMARMVDVSEDTAHLEKESGEKVDVPLDKLSTADRRLARRLLRKLKEEAEADENDGGPGYSGEFAGRRSAGGTTREVPPRAADEFETREFGGQREGREGPPRAPPPAGERLAAGAPLPPALPQDRPNAAPGAGPPAPPGLPPLRPDAGPDAPDQFVFSPRFDCVDGQIEAGAAFAIRLPGQRSAVILSALQLLGPVGGLERQMDTSELQQSVKNVVLSDLFNPGSEFEIGSQPLLIDQAAPLGTSAAAGDIVAFVVPDRLPLQAGVLARGNPREGEPVWLAAPLSVNADPRQRTHAARVSGYEDQNLRYAFDRPDITLPPISGAPVLNAAGEVIAIHVGTRVEDGITYGIGNPVERFAPHLVQALGVTTGREGPPPRPGPPAGRPVPPSPDPRTAHGPPNPHQAAPTPRPDPHSPAPPS